jgi:hypothetical protein
MNRRPRIKAVPAVPRKKPRRKRGIVPTGGQAPLNAKELKQHARLLAEGKPMSGRSGPFVYYILNRKQCWRRYSVPQGQSGPLTGQQNYIGQNSTRKQRDYQMLSHPRQREQEKGKHKRLKSELTVQVSRPRPITRPTSGTRRAHTVPAPSILRARSGNAGKPKARQLMSQMPRLQKFTRPTSGRPQTSARALPGQRQRQANQPKGTGKRGSLKRPSKPSRARGNARRHNLSRGG